MLFRSRASASDHEKTVMRGVVKLQAAVRRKRAHSSFLRMDETDALPLRDAWAIWLFLAHVIAVMWVGSPHEFSPPDTHLSSRSGRGWISEARLTAALTVSPAPPGAAAAVASAETSFGFLHRCIPSSAAVPAGSHGPSSSAQRSVHLKPSESSPERSTCSQQQV